VSRFQKVKFALYVEKYARGLILLMKLKAVPVNELSWRAVPLTCKKPFSPHCSPIYLPEPKLSRLQVRYSFQDELRTQQNLRAVDAKYSVFMSCNFHFAASSGFVDQKGHTPRQNELFKTI